MQLFYNPNINESLTSFVFDKEESKHIIKVLRKQERDILYVTNGLGYLFKTMIALASDSKCTVNVLSFSIQDMPKFNLHIAVAPTKMNERYEWFLEKATEIGVQEITPIICEHSERKKLNEPILLKDFLKKEITGQKFIAHCEEADKKSLKSQLISNENVTILIGPEGDFSVKEIEMALNNKYNPISLGETRLRTETAALVACHSVVFINN